MAYQSNLLGDFWRGYRQKRIGTGMPLSQNEMGGLLGPMLLNDANKAETQGRLDLQRQQFDRQMSLQEKAQANQNMAGMVGGVGQLAQLPMAYGAAKSMGWFGGGSTAPVASLMGPTGAATAQGAVAPAVASTTAQGSLLSGAADAGLAGGTATAGTMGAVGAETAAPSLLGAASTAALPAAAGALGGHLLGKPVSKLLGTHEKTTSDVMSIAGGAAMGFAVGGPIGGAIGAGIGLISSLF